MSLPYVLAELVCMGLYRPSIKRIPMKIEPPRVVWTDQEEKELKGYLDAMLEIEGGETARARYLLQKETGTDPKVVLDRAYIWIGKHDAKRIE